MKNRFLTGLILGFLSALMLLLWQNCIEGGSTAGNPASSEPPLEQVNSKFLPYTVNEEIVVELCVRGFRVLPEDNNGQGIQLTSLIQFFILDPEGSEIGLFVQTPLETGDYDGRIGFDMRCASGNSVYVSNSFGEFAIQETVGWDTLLTKTADEYGNEHWLVPTQPLVDVLANVQSRLDLICLFRDHPMCE